MGHAIIRETWCIIIALDPAYDYEYHLQPMTVNTTS